MNLDLDGIIFFQHFDMLFLFFYFVTLTHPIFLPPQPLLQYLIFPAQFAYLYSYYPSGDMEKLPEQLEEVWKARHFEDAEKMFAAVADGSEEVKAGPSFFKNAEVEEEVVA